MATQVLDIFSPCLHRLKSTMEGGELLELGDCRQPAGHARYHFGKIPLKSIEARYHVARCVKCHESRGHLGERLHPLGRIRARSRIECGLASIEAELIQDIEKLLRGVQTDGDGPQLSVIYRDDVIAIGPEISVDEAKTIVEQLASKVARDTMQWADRAARASRAGGRRE